MAKLENHQRKSRGNKNKRIVIVKFLVLMLLIPPAISDKVGPASKRHFIKLKSNHNNHNNHGAVPVYRQRVQPIQKLINSPQVGKILIQQVPSLPPHLQKVAKSPLSPSTFKKSLPPKHFPIAPAPHHPTSLATKCKGRKNIIDDLGILSLVTAATASAFGLYTVIVNSMTSNNIGIVSGFFSLAIWLPATLLTVLNITGDTAQLLGNFLNGLSFINSMYGFMGVFFGTADVLASTVGETIGIISFILSVIATFPELLDTMIEYMYRMGNRPRLEYFVENYGCSVPTIFALEGEPLYEVVNRFLVEGFDMKTASLPEFGPNSYFIPPQRFSKM